LDADTIHSYELVTADFIKVTGRTKASQITKQGSREDVVDRLRALGVDVLTTTELVPPAENLKRCPWLDWDICERIERKLPDGSIQFHEVPRHWRRGTEPGETLDFRPQPKV
jgi:hypothetical protein